MELSAGVLALVAITFLAAFVNGALGYGFSSLTVPVGLVLFTNRVLNPALVLIEVFINLYVLVINRSAIAAVWGRVAPIVLGLLPGVALGSAVPRLPRPEHPPTTLCTATTRSIRNW